MPFSGRRRVATRGGLQRAGGGRQPAAGPPRSMQPR
ncbi:hypothetical protein QJQ45_023574 [Haematococcus lacustris]|nr:hypothetical protein QJQ45_023574 [Haematococcus lacustris]